MARSRAILAVLLLLGAASMLVSLAVGQAPEERAMVAAVADADQNRILVRWRSDEGKPRYAYLDVLRRAAAGGDLVQVNAKAVGPLLAVEDIGLFFTDLDNADALAAIEASLGTDYASEILKIQSAGAPPEAQLQRRLLPEQNYGAAVVMGLGFLDDGVVPGETYVYEVWGLDELGFRAERLGRATATGAPDLPAKPLGLTCVAMGGAQGDLAAGLRWKEPASFVPIFGYDVLRVRANADGGARATGSGTSSARLRSTTSRCSSPSPARSRAAGRFSRRPARPATAPTTTR